MRYKLMQYSAAVLTAALIIFFGSPIAKSRAEEPDVVILSCDLNPAGRDEGREWVMLFNQLHTPVHLAGWSICTSGKSSRFINVQGSIPARGRYTVVFSGHFLPNAACSIRLRNNAGVIVDKTPELSDQKNDNQFWKRNPGSGSAKWDFMRQEPKPGIPRTVTIHAVEDGDTFVAGPIDDAGLQTIRLVGIDAPERGTADGDAVSNEIRKTYIGKQLILDLDDQEVYDPYNRLLGVFWNGTLNVNRDLQRDPRIYKLIIMPSEFVPCPVITWKPASIKAGEPVIFSAQGSWTLDSWAPVKEYGWSINPDAGPVFRHTFEQPGAYDVTLTIRDKKGRINQNSQTVIVVE